MTLLVLVDLIFFGFKANSLTAETVTEPRNAFIPVTLFRIANMSGRSAYVHTQCRLLLPPPLPNLTYRS